MRRLLYELLESTVSSLVVIFILYLFIAMPEVVWGASMEPNFFTGERIIVEKVSKYFKAYVRGEVVVLKPEGTEKHFIKRVVGVPGDIIKIMDCGVYISRDGKKYRLDENYLGTGVCTSGGAEIKEGRAIKIEEDKYLVLGDNRGISLDSRNIGLVEKGDIVGRVAFRFWPLAKMGFIN